MLDRMLPRPIDNTHAGPRLARVLALSPLSAWLRTQAPFELSKVGAFEWARIRRTEAT